MWSVRAKQGAWYFLAGLSGSARAIFAPTECTPRENNQADACVLPGPLLLRLGISSGQRGAGSTVPAQAAGRAHGLAMPGLRACQLGSR